MNMRKQETNVHAISLDIAGSHELNQQSSLFVFTCFISSDIKKTIIKFSSFFLKKKKD